MRQACFRLFLILLALAGTGLRASGQETPPKPPAEPGVEEVGPATVYLKDEKGNLVPVSGATYERFLELLLKERRAVGEVEPPAFTIEKLEVTGTQNEKTIEWNVAATIQLRKASWVLVPMRMSGLHLRGPIEVDDKISVIHRHSAKEGHALWLNGEESRRAVVQLPLTGSLTKSATEFQTTLSLPMASESHLKLSVPGEVQSPLLKLGEGLLKTSFADNRTTIDIAGASGDLTLQWQETKGTSADAPQMEVASEITARFESQDAISLQADMRVVRRGMNRGPLFVRLPPKFELSGRGGRGYAISPASEKDLADHQIDLAAIPNTQIVRVDVDPPAETMDFSIPAALKRETERSASPVELGGFQLIGAARESGFVNIFSPRGWSLKGTSDSMTERTDIPAPPMAGQPTPSVRYRFVRQPFSLQVETSPQPSRILVEPKYAITIDARQARLTATLKYQVRGPRPEKLSIDIGDWQLDAVAPVDLVTLDDAATNGRRTNLTLQSGSTNEFEVILQLHQNLATSKDLNFGLIRPFVSQLMPATLTLATDENITVTPLLDKSVGLVRETRPSISDAGPTSPARLYFREIASPGELPRLAAEIQIHPRRVTAMLDATADVLPTTIRVQQSMSLDVAYESLRSLELQLPRGVPLEGLQVFLGEQWLQLATIPAAGQTGPLVRVTLPAPLLGSAVLTAKYSVPRGSAEPFSLPLVSPAPSVGIVVARQKLQVRLPMNEALEFVDSIASTPSSAGANFDPTLHAEWSESHPLVTLQTKSKPLDAGAGLSLQRTWIQIWLDRTARRDRFVSQLTSDRLEFEAELPAEIPLEDVRVRIDGVAPRQASVNGRRLAVKFDPAQHSTRTVEIWCRLPAEPVSSWPQTLRIQPLQLLDASAAEQTLVQIITPPGEQILSCRSSLSPQMAWRKRGWLWQRGGELTTTELETWSGATQHDAAVTETNDALYMTLGQLDTVEVLVWGRRWLWFCGAGGALLIGWLLIVVARGRSLWVIVGTAAVALVAVLIAPEFSLVLAQFLGLGLLLLLAVAWSMRLLGHRWTAPAVPPSALSESRVIRPETTSVRTRPASSVTATAEMRP